MLINITVYVRRIDRFILQYVDIAIFSNMYISSY